MTNISGINDMARRTDDNDEFPIIITRDEYLLDIMSIDNYEIYDTVKKIFNENCKYNKILIYDTIKPLPLETLLKVDGIYLLISNNNNNDFINNLPTNILYLNLGLSNHPGILPTDIALNSLPIYLEHLIIRSNVINTAIDNLPPNLISLILKCEYRFPLNNLPWSLKKLQMFGAYNVPLISLPPNLESLTLSEYYEIELTNLPLTLKYLYIGLNYFKKLNLSYLTQLEELEIDGFPVIEELPEKLKKLSIGFEASPKITQLNNNLETIETYYHNLNLLIHFLDIHCPKKLQKIIISSIYRLYIPTKTILYEKFDNIQNKYNNQFTISVDD